MSKNLDEIEQIGIKYAQDKLGFQGLLVIAAVYSMRRHRKEGNYDVAKQFADLILERAS